jgi:hypothetical protein
MVETKYPTLQMLPSMYIVVSDMPWWVPVGPCIPLVAGRGASPSQPCGILNPAVEI